MEYLNCSIDYLNLKGGLATAKEICNQPRLWEQTYLMLNERSNEISEFLKQVTEKDHPIVILTGAGTSAFIGETLKGIFQKKWKVPCLAISTTDIVTHPENYFIRSSPTLLISFGRSGNSPESIAAIEEGRKHCDMFYELNITCNAVGRLAEKNEGENSYVILLPEETNDSSLAMTSSYSSMLLTGLLLTDLKNSQNFSPLMKKIRLCGEYILNNCLSDLKTIAELDFERMVFLGSGPLLGVAQESQLKVQELSDGNIICKHDSFLGFRHGPRAVVNDDTFIVYLLSNNPFVKSYEFDLIQSIKAKAGMEKTLVIGQDERIEDTGFDFTIQFPMGMEDIPEDFLSIFYILPAQIIGFYKSLSLGLSPDSPSRNGSISRVVEGVKIYDSKPLDNW